MDTRTKILRWPADVAKVRERLAGEPSLRVVAGYFDPLLAAHARRLAEIAGASRLLVLVTSPVHPLLPLAARTELAAALGTVECAVEVPPSALRDVLRLVPADRLVLEQAADARRAEELVRHVHARQKSAPAGR